MKGDLTKIFSNGIYTKPPEKKIETSRIIYNHFDENWSIDLIGFSDYKMLNNKRYR